MIDLDAIRRAIDPDAPARGDIRCPVHRDKRPSLSLALSANGRLMVHCHAGCDQGAVWDEVRSRAGAVLPGHVEAELNRWQRRAQLAEGKLAELALMLDEYRVKGRPMPTYSELARLLHAPE